MKVQEFPLDSIIPYARNPRRGPAIEKVASSIKEFGFRQPIVVDPERVIIAGHTRYEAAKRLGLKTAPVHVAEGLTRAQVKAYRIADNRVARDTPTSGPKMDRGPHSGFRRHVKTYSFQYVPATRT
jgi:ParB-like chromosome segregation protein Spo0J